MLNPKKGCIRLGYSPNCFQIYCSCSAVQMRQPRIGFDCKRPSSNSCLSFELIKENSDNCPLSFQDWWQLFETAATEFGSPTSARSWQFSSSYHRLGEDPIGDSNSHVSMHIGYSNWAVLVRYQSSIISCSGLQKLHSSAPACATMCLCPQVCTFGCRLLDIYKRAVPPCSQEPAFSVKSVHAYLYVHTAWGNYRKVLGCWGWASCLSSPWISMCKLPSLKCNFFQRGGGVGFVIFMLLFLNNGGISRDGMLWDQMVRLDDA